MKKLFTAVLAFVFTVFTLIGVASCGSSKGTIAVVKYGTHTSLDEIEDAVEAEIEAKLDMNKYEIKEYDCNFDSAIITQTISSIKSKKNVTAVVAIATPVAAVAKSMLTDIPVVFAAVSDPVGAEILTNMNAPEGNITGTSDAIDITKLVDLSYSVNQDVKKLGYIYTSSEANSLSNLAKLKAYASEKGYTLVEKPISNAAEITEAANSILGDIDGLIVTDDNNVASAMSVLSGLCMEKDVPMYCAADSEIKDGGMMGYSISYTKLGTVTGDMVVSIAGGTAVKDIPVKVFDATELSLFYNSKFTKGSNVVIPEALLATATDLAA